MCADNNGLAEKAQELKELEAEFAVQRHTASSTDGVATVTVDGAGQLVDLQLAPGLFRRPHLDGLGAQILEAIERARGAAAEEQAAHVARLFPTMAATPSGEAG